MKNTLSLNNFYAVAALLALFACATALAQVPVTGASVSLGKLVGTDTLVTVVLKGSSAEDPNLKIVELAPTYLAALSESGERVVYLYGMLSEVRVQGGVVEKPKLARTAGVPLSDEEQQILNRALARTREIFDAANNDQQLKMRAALLLAVHTEEDAHTYLQMLQQSNDMKTQLQASRALWLAGEATPEQIIKDGLRSGNREIRATSAMLAGLNNYQDAVPTLYRMSQDRVAEISSPAARALALLANRDYIPTLIELLRTPNEDKRAAAVFAFTQLGGDDVIAQLKLMLNDSQGLLRYNIILILHNLGDPLGRQLLVETFESAPTLEADAALILARDRHPGAIQFLRNRLERREDPTDYNLRYRAENAASLIAGGEPSKKAVFQELLRLENTEVVSRVFELITKNGNRDLITLARPVIENKNPKLAITACEAVVALANANFRDRLTYYIP